MLSTRNEALAAHDKDSGPVAARSLFQPAAALISWTDALFSNIERELHALRIDQEEREFFATDHGCAYATPNDDLLTIRRRDEDQT